MVQKEIKICDIPWKIIFADRIKDLNNPNSDKYTLGLCDYDNKIITISLKDEKYKIQSKKQVNITIIHELLHAILFEGSYEHDDEELIEFLATNLQSTLAKLKKL